MKARKELLILFCFWSILWMFYFFQVRVMGSSFKFQPPSLTSGRGFGLESKNRPTLVLTHRTRHPADMNHKLPKERRNWGGEGGGRELKEEFAQDNGDDNLWRGANILAICGIRRTALFWLAIYIYSQSAILKTKSYKIMFFFFVIFNSHNSIKKRKLAIYVAIHGSSR